VLLSTSTLLTIAVEEAIRPPAIQAKARNRNNMYFIATPMGLKKNGMVERGSVSLHLSER
jgi:hypothetical protein